MASTSEKDPSISRLKSQTGQSSQNNNQNADCDGHTSIDMMNDSSIRWQDSSYPQHSGVSHTSSVEQNSTGEITTPDIFDFSSVAVNSSVGSDEENTLSACLMKIFDSARSKKRENGELKSEDSQDGDIYDAISAKTQIPCYRIDSVKFCPGCDSFDSRLCNPNTSITSSEESGNLPSVCSLCGQSVSEEVKPSYSDDNKESCQVRQKPSSSVHCSAPDGSFFLDCLSTAEFGKVDKLRAWRAAGAALRQVLTKTSESDTSGCTSNIGHENVDEEDPMNVMLEEFNASTTGSSQEKEDTETTQVSVLDRVRERLNAFNQRSARSSHSEYLRTSSGPEADVSQSPGLLSVREKIRQITASRIPARSGTDGSWSRRRVHNHRHSRSCQLSRGDSQEKQNSSDSEVEESEQRRLKPVQRCRKSSCPTMSTKLPYLDLPHQEQNVTQDKITELNSACAVQSVTVSKSDDNIVKKNNVSKSKSKMCQSWSGSSIDSLEQTKCPAEPTVCSEVNDSSELELDSIAEKLGSLGWDPSASGSAIISSRAARCKRLGLVENDSMLNLADVESISEEVEEEDEEEDTLQHHQDLLYCPACQDDPLSQSCSSCDYVNNADDLELPDLSCDTDQDVEEPKIQLNASELDSLPELVSESCSSCASDQDGEEADDEFECDCMVCQERRAQLSLEWMTEEEEEYLGRQEDDRIEYHSSNVDDQNSGQPYAINLAELTPLDLLLMREGRRELLELMFQNVILQMLAVYPDLLGDQAPPPATEHTINSLPAVIIREEQKAPDFVCPICLCQFSGGEEGRCLPCEHLFHTLCIEAWLAKSGTCPVCRHILIPQDPINSSQL